MEFNANIEQAFINVAVLWMLTTPHEFAHAWVATKLGDDTPEQQGRVTLYPPAHIDWIGTTILPFVTSLVSGGFIGWGKPVMTNPNKLRYGMWGTVLVALAGPFSNVLFTILLCAIAALSGNRFLALTEFCTSAALLSFYLALLNLLPVPPFDGSKLLLALRLPAIVYRELSQFGFLMVLVLLSATRLGDYLNLFAYEFTRSVLRLFLRIG